MVHGLSNPVSIIFSKTLISQKFNLKIYKHILMNRIYKYKIEGRPRAEFIYKQSKFRKARNKVSYVTKLVRGCLSIKNLPSRSLYETKEDTDKMFWQDLIF